MSLMLCTFCKSPVDTDADPDSLYVKAAPDRCVCKWCRDDRELATEFDE